MDRIEERHDPRYNRSYFYNHRTGKSGWSREEVEENPVPKTEEISASKEQTQGSKLHEQSFSQTNPKMMCVVCGEILTAIMRKCRRCGKVRLEVVNDTLKFIAHFYAQVVTDRRVKDCRMSHLDREGNLTPIDQTNEPKFRRKFSKVSGI